MAFRADAAFARPAIYEMLEQHDVDYAIRRPANKALEVEIEDILFRPPGRPSRKPLVRYKSFRYQANRVGPRPDGLLPRWSTTGVSCSLASASS